MSYQNILPEAFPYMVVVDHEFCRSLLVVLMNFNERLTPNGSSFAVTSDADTGFWNLWLSRISYNRLVDLKLVAGKDDE